MTLTHEIFNDLFEAAKKVSSKQQVSKVYILPNNREIIYAVSCQNDCRYLYFEVTNNVDKDFPECRGIGIGSVKLLEYSATKLFCELRQISSAEGYIFEVIIEDMRKRGENNNNTLLEIAISVLRKWQEFFSKDRQVLMSTVRQQGLYGELKLLEDLISFDERKAVLCWAGCKFETHDFYINGNAIEVKTTSKKAPYRMHISSEYQLDGNDVSGAIYIKFFALRKSESDGETLPELIRKIRTLIKGNSHTQKKFEEDLEEYGYFDAVAYKYTSGYVKREDNMFEARAGFPRLIRAGLVKGVSNCTYDVLVDECKDFEVSSEATLKELMKGLIIDE